MAIRPVDLQGAFAAATQAGTVIRNAEEAPAVAQQAQNANFAAKVAKREETIEESTHVVGNKVQPRGDRDPDHSTEEQLAEQEGRPRTFAEVPEPPHPLGLAGEGQHFIDVTA